MQIITTQPHPQLSSAPLKLEWIFFWGCNLNLKKSGHSFLQLDVVCCAAAGMSETKLIYGDGDSYHWVWQQCSFFGVRRYTTFRGWAIWSLKAEKNNMIKCQGSTLSEWFFVYTYMKGIIPSTNNATPQGVSSVSKLEGFFLLPYSSNGGVVGLL